MAIISAVLLLGILIFVHELGHFLFAKLMGVKVLKFSLGFGPKLLGKKFGETEYLISSVPLGGYVKMSGEEPSEEQSEAEVARTFKAQPLRKRFLIVVSGPLFNIFFAALLFALIFMGGIPVLYPDVGDVMEGMPAEKAGFQKGDRILKIGGSEIGRWDEMTGLIHKNAGKPLEFIIKRNESVISLKAVPQAQKVKDIFGEEREIGLIGIKPLGSQFTQRYSPLEALTMAAEKTYDVVVLTVVSIIKLIQWVIPAGTIGGPILILQMAGEQASAGALNFFTFMAVISVNLGVLNLLPIPVLDGGLLTFMGIEAIRRKPLSEQTMLIAQRVGVALIVALMAFALYNDILRLLTGRDIP